MSGMYCSLKLATVLSSASCIWAGISNTLALSLASDIKTLSIDIGNFAI